jgi:hypothetical protein
MKELPLALRLRLEQLMCEIASARTVDAFFKCQEKARELKFDLERCYEEQQDAFDKESRCQQKSSH